ncbi:unnamed protein product [Clonostachys byssicola]|uniref:Uncharacterized protein n=1 Tax=Clonostachys byssicola TaxID=160290 RepID=A0A9N9UHK2_9HYPO|nr:unnamed protein product [Clonostachys byssicola]
MTDGLTLSLGSSAMLGFYSFDGRYSPSPGPAETPPCRCQYHRLLSRHIHDTGAQLQLGGLPAWPDRSRAMMGDASKRAAVGAFTQHGVADSLMPGNDALCDEAAHQITAGLRVEEQAHRSIAMT